MPKFEVGQEWFTKEDRKRLASYEMMDALFRGDRSRWRSLWQELRGERSGGRKLPLNHETGQPDLDEYSRREDRGGTDSVLGGAAPKHYKYMPLMPLIVRTHGQFVFNKPIRVKKTKNEEGVFHVRRLVKDCDLLDVGKRVLRHWWVNGDAVVRLRTGTRATYSDDRIRALIDVIPSEFYFPEFASGSDYEVERAHIVRKVERDKQAYLLVETHEPGAIEYKIYEVDTADGKIKAEVEFEALESTEPEGGDESGATDRSPNRALWDALWPTVEEPRLETGVDRLLVWHISNAAYKGAWGSSPLESVLDLFDDTNRKMGGLSHMHDVTTSPKLTVPETAVKQDSEKGTITFNFSDVIPTAPHEGADQYKWVEIMGNGPTMTLDYARDLIDFICMLTSAPRSIFKAQRDGGGNESGTAIKRKAVATSLLAMEFIEDFKSMMEEVLWYAQQIEVEQGLEVELYRDGESPSGTAESDDDDTGVEMGEAAYPPRYPELEIQFGVFDDVDVDGITKKLESGLITREDALLEANPGFDPERVGDYMAAIDEDLANTPSGQLTQVFRDGFGRGAAGVAGGAQDSVVPTPTTETNNELASLAESARAAGE